MTNPLYRRYPRVAAALPHVQLADLPTPIDCAASLSGALGVSGLYIKRDDLTGPHYGGNKVRKLEYLLGKAQKHGVREVLTFGFAGSNHALATALYAQKTGMRSISMLLPQVNSRALRRNLLMSYHCGAELHHYASRPLLKAGLPYQLLRHRLKCNAWPMVIPAGGSSPIGIMGIVNAALELREQIDQGAMPMPDRIYVAVGSMGTAVGLAIGLAMAVIPATLVSVRVIDSSLASEKAFRALLSNTLSFMHAADPSLRVDLAKTVFALREDFFGERYALYTEAGMEAIALLEGHTGIRLDGTYSGKAFAALVGDARSGQLAGQTVLFWNTYNSRPFWETMPEIDYHQLPRTLHRYFEDPVQPLDH